MALANCERVPDAVAIAVLDGLASTGNAPISPAATLPAPMPIRSRLRVLVAGTPAPDRRIVAAVCAMHTKATVSTKPAMRRSCEKETDGRRTCGSPPFTVPRIATPW